MNSYLLPYFLTDDANLIKKYKIILDWKHWIEKLFMCVRDSPLPWSAVSSHMILIAIDNARAAVKAARSEYNSKHASKW